MWQAEADTELTLSASPATAVGQLTLTLANWRYSTVLTQTFIVKLKPHIFTSRLRHGQGIGWVRGGRGGQLAFS